MKKYTFVGLGGTFDHFHAGHQQFLSAIAAQAEYLIIGVTQPELTTYKVKSDLLEPFETRCQAVTQFCQEHHIAHQIVPLTDIYGPTLTDTRIQAVFVTSDTESGGHRINERRAQLNLAPLPIEKVPLLLDEVGTTIASQRIRTGAITRNGAVYSQLFSHPITLNPSQRQFFAQLQGQIVQVPQSLDQSKISIVVGDSSFETFEAQQWPYTLAVIDFKKQRQVYQPEPGIADRVQLSVVNPPGVITPKLAVALQTALDKNFSLLSVDGEEDLAAVVAVLVLPLNSLVYYGQPGEGMAEVLVTEALKEQFLQVLHHTNPNLPQTSKI